MNRIYHSIWNRALGAWVAAPETASAAAGTGTPSLTTSAPTAIAGGTCLVPWARWQPTALGLALLGAGILPAQALVANLVLTGPQTTIGATDIYTGNSGTPGSSGMTGGAGEAGGAGVQRDNSINSTTVLTLTNSGTVSGGIGGSGGKGLSLPPVNMAGFGGVGGAGGAGIQGDYLSITNLSSISAGDGGLGGSGVPSGAGGSGGTGIRGNHLTIINQGSINAGNGVSGGNLSGGSGGAGIAGDDISITNSGAIRGGNGATGTPGVAGGTAIVGTNLAITNRGAISGGNGGSAGSGIVGTNLSIANNGSISGGNTAAGTYGLPGGAGIDGTNLFIVNSGAINAGVGTTATTAIRVNGGADNRLISNSGASYGGSIAIQGTSTILTLAQTTAAGATAGYSYSSIFSGNGALKVLTDADKSVTLTGANTYTGGTTISGGTLLAANASALGTGNVTVGRGAALEVTRGTTLAVGGNLTFQSGSTYRVQADLSTSSSSHVAVDGTASLGGAAVQVQAQGSLGAEQNYTILSAKQLQGSFGPVSANYAYLSPTLSQTDTEVVLRLVRKQVDSIPPDNSGTPTPDAPRPLTFSDLAQSTNQAALARGIESLGRGNPLFNHIETLLSGAPPSAFNSLSGDLHTNVASSLVGLGAFAPSVSGQHLHSNLTAGMNAGAAVAQSDGPLPASAWPSSKALPAWAEVVGHWQRYDGDGNAATLKQRTTGLFLGMDQEVGASGWRVGGSVGTTQAKGKVADRASESDVNSYSAAVYGGKSFGTGTGPRINVLGGLAYTWHDIATTRRIDSLDQTLKADYSAHTAQLFAEVGYAIGQYDQFGLEPFVGMSLGQQRSNSFQERGGFAALSGQSSTDDLTSTTLGLRVHSDFQVAGKDAHLRATVGWRHAFGDVKAEKTMAFEGGQNFTVAGAPLARNTAVLGLEGEIALSRRAALVVGYRGEVGNGQRDHSANAKMRWAF